jgi:CBS domain-containing protein
VKINDKMTKNVVTVATTATAAEAAKKMQLENVGTFSF